MEDIPDSAGIEEGLKGRLDPLQGGSAPLGDDAVWIERRVIQLFALVGEALVGATDVLLSGDRELGRVLVERDSAVDSLYGDIESLVLRQLVLGRTSPAELHFLITVLRMLPELERSGDLAEHIAQRGVRGLGREMNARSRGLVERMGEVATRMWRMATDAYVDRAASLAEQLERLDDEMDDLHVTLTAELVAGEMSLPVALELALVARFYERFGDHAVNLSRRVASYLGDVLRDVAE